LTEEPDEPDIGDILATAVEAGDDDTVSFGDVMGAFGARVFGPMLMVPAFIAVAPTGAIPGMSLLTGSVIGLIAVQLLVVRKRPWLPARLTEASLARDRLNRAVERAMPYAKRVDQLTRPRLVWLTAPPLQQVLAGVCLLMALAMFPLALLPFAVALPGTAVLLIGVGLTTRDGYFAVAGVLIAVAALAVPSAWFAGWLT